MTCFIVDLLKATSTSDPVPVFCMSPGHIGLAFLSAAFNLDFSLIQVCVCVCGHASPPLPHPHQTTITGINHLGSRCISFNDRTLA